MNEDGCEWVMGKEEEEEEGDVQREKTRRGYMAGRGQRDGAFPVLNDPPGSPAACSPLTVFIMPESILTDFPILLLVKRRLRSGNGPRKEGFCETHCTFR